MFTLAISIIGLVIGTAGFILGVLNYRRDRAVVKVSLEWDVSLALRGIPFPGTFDPNRPCGVISVTNIGRRPVYITQVGIGHWIGKDPRLKSSISDDSFLMAISDSVEGAKLGEGDPPRRYAVSQSGLETWGHCWRGVRAYVKDSTGKFYSSPPAENRPSWAIG